LRHGDVTAVVGSDDATVYITRSESAAAAAAAVEHAVNYSHHRSVGGARGLFSWPRALPRTN